MSFFGGYNNYNGRGGGFPRPRHQNARFGIAPLMRPNNQQRPRMGMSPRGGRPPFRGGNHGPNQHRFRSPGRDDSFRMRGPRPPHNMSYNRTIKPDQQPPGNTEDFTKDVDMTEIIETKPAVDTITPNISKSEVTESKQPQSAEEPKKEEVSKVEVKEEIKQEDIKPTPKMELDRYNSELHVKLSQDNLVGEILKGDGFQYMWGGVRGTHGVKRGMVCYEVHILEYNKVDLPNEKNPCVARVGWSVDGSDFQLGEDKLSWGYGGTGKSSVDSKFRDYGKPFGAGDVITCYVDLNKVPKAIFFALNGEYLGVAFRFTNELGDKALYPHITVKNVTFRVNFAKEPPKYPLTNGFKMIGTLPEPDVVSPPPGPKLEKEAEVIVMVGLPGSGKSYWCENYKREHPDKKYYILGTNLIIDRMKVSGLTRKRNYHGRWEELIKRASGVLNKLFTVTKANPRNYILDQTNVYFTARRRKMEAFRNYKRKAVVVVNKPPVLAQRIEKQRQLEGKVVPDQAIMEMKKNFTLPECGPSFDEILYVDEQLPTAREIVQQIRKEGEKFKKEQTTPGKSPMPAGSKRSSPPRHPEQEKRPKLEPPSDRTPTRGPAPSDSRTPTNRTPVSAGPPPNRTPGSAGPPPSRTPGSAGPALSRTPGSTGPPQRTPGSSDRMGRSDDSRSDRRDDDRHHRHESRREESSSSSYREGRPSTRIEGSRGDGRYPKDEHRSSSRDTRDRDSRDGRDRDSRSYQRRDDSRNDRSRPSSTRRDDPPRFDSNDRKTSSGRLDDRRDPSRDRFNDRSSSRADSFRDRIDRPKDSYPDARSRDAPPPRDRAAPPHAETNRAQDARVNDDSHRSTPIYQDPRYATDTHLPPPPPSEDRRPLPGDGRRPPAVDVRRPPAVDSHRPPYDRHLEPYNDAYPPRSDVPAARPEQPPASRSDLPPRNQPSQYDREYPPPQAADTTPYGRRPVDQPPQRDQPPPRDQPLYERRDERYPADANRHYDDRPRDAYPPKEGDQYFDRPPQNRPEDAYRRPAEAAAPYVENDRYGAQPPRREAYEGQQPPRDDYYGRREEFPPRRDEFPPRREEFPPRRDEFPVKREEGFPKREEAFPKREEGLPHRRDEIPPPRRDAVPSRHGDLPKRRDDFPPKTDEYPPRRDEYPPRDDYRREDPPRPAYDERYDHRTPERRPYYEQDGQYPRRDEYDDRRAPPPHQARDAPPYGRNERDYQQSAPADDYHRGRYPPSHEPRDYPHQADDRRYDQDSRYHQENPPKEGDSRHGDTNESYNRMNRERSSYQTQMTTSTANYGHTTSTSESYLRNEAITSRDDRPKPPPRDEERFRGFDRERGPPPPAQPNPADRGTQSYEKQQEDYQKAYSQWYQNYAQAFAALSEQDKK